MEQIPVNTANARTIQKLQGRSLENTGIWIPVYVALSRVRVRIELFCVNLWNMQNAKRSQGVRQFLERLKKTAKRRVRTFPYIDGMNINGVSFLGTVSRKIMYSTAHSLQNQQITSYRSVLDRVCRICDHAGVKTIFWDNQFRPLLRTQVDRYGVRKNYANPQEQSWVLTKNDIQATFHRGPSVAHGVDKTVTVSIKGRHQSLYQSENDSPPTSPGFPKTLRHSTRCIRIRTTWAATSV